jgi:alkylation response protein AidB-like acyl-CoA dehydrogenase
LYEISKKIDKGERCSQEAAMIKYFATEAACRGADEATRIFGSYGFSSEYPVARFFADTRFLLFGGGTSEILQNNIAREILDK